MVNLTSRNRTDSGGALMRMIQFWTNTVGALMKILIWKFPLSAGHNEGVIGSLEYEILNDGLSTINHPYMAKYYITAGYGQRSDVLDSVKG